VAIEGERKNLVYIRGFLGINVTSVEFGLRESFAEVLEEHLLQRSVAEISKAERSKQPDLVPASALLQQRSLSNGTVPLHITIG
jgi:hypothetical protein